MTNLQSNPAVVDDAVARLTDMFRNQPVIRALTTVLARRWSAYEAVLLDLYAARWLDNATGALLDAAGELVGEPRLGRSDELYRLWIKARIRINRSHGKIADNYRLVRLIAGEGVTVHYIPTPPAAYKVEVENTDVDALELYKLLDSVRPAGVRMNLEYAPDLDLSTIFTLSDTGSTITGDFDKGLGDVGDPDVGGRLRGVL